jgi:hypothetical protein
MHSTHYHCHYTPYALQVLALRLQSEATSHRLFLPTPTTTLTSTFSTTTASTTATASTTPLYRVAYRLLLSRWGTPCLAERALHDLYSNCRNLSAALPRLRLFGAMSGCLPGPGMTGDSELRDDGESPLVVLVRTSNVLNVYF